MSFVSGKRYNSEFKDGKFGLHVSQEFKNCLCDKVFYSKL